MVPTGANNSIAEFLLYGSTVVHCSTQAKVAHCSIAMLHPLLLVGFCPPISQVALLMVSWWICSVNLLICTHSARLRYV